MAAPRDITPMAQEAAAAFRARMREVKPRLRGWLHAGTTPLALAAGIVLVLLSPTTTTRIGSAIFAGTALLLLTVSAIYHRGTWSPRGWAFLRRFDHANIFLLIAGSYTPFALVLLHGGARVGLLSIVWGGALLGVVFRIFWTTAPRWLYVPIYIAMGWVAVFYVWAVDFPGWTVTILVAGGGVFYTLGGVVYGVKWPDPIPRWFGFHEVFHAFTVCAIVCHFFAVSIMTFRLR